MPLHKLPCVRCQKRGGFKFPEVKNSYGYRCPKCETVFRAHIYYVRDRKAQGLNWIPGLGIGSWVRAALFTHAWFELVAAVNLTRDDWLTTRSGGMDRVKSFLSFGD